MTIGSVGASSAMYHLQNAQYASSLQASHSLDRDHDGDTDLGGVDNNDSGSGTNQLSTSGKGQYINVLA